MMVCKVAYWLCAMVPLVLGIVLWRTRQRLFQCEKQKQEVERSSQVLEEERHVLELIARGATLKEVLEGLTQAVENIVPAMCCSVLLVDHERGCLVQGAAPHLPPEFWKLCEQLPIADFGCCPAAVFHNETMISEDLATDPRWTSISALVVGLGLRSCWSVPIRDSDTNRVIGTFAMYRSHRASPSPDDLRVVRAGAQLAGNAIERLRAVQQMRDHVERFALAEKAAEFGIWEWNPATGWFDLSGSAARMAGLGDQARRATLAEVYSTIDPEHQEAARLSRENAFLRGGGYEHEFRRVSDDSGATRWFRNRGNVELREGKPFKVIGAIIDITEQKTLLASLEGSKLAAENAAQIKGEFLANMSHEIRTPMNAVIGMASLLEDLDLSPEALDCVQTIRTSSDALLGIINDILDFSKIESGKLDLERLPFSLSRLLEEAGELLARRAAEKGLDLSVSIDPAAPDWVYGDPTRVRQVLVNLIGNAVKFTERGELVIAARVLSEARPAEVVIDVRDTGIGIPSDKQDRLFQSFSQVDSSTTRRFGGTGLGLSISKKLAELMGGTLTVVSQEDVGSTFTLAFPFEPAVAVGPPPLTGQSDWVGKRVLVVDDNPTIRHILDVYLSGWKFSVELASSASAALHRIRAAPSPFDLLILDSHLPGMDGIELARAIGSELGAAAPPIVILSSSSTSARSALDGRQGPLAAHLAKPIRRQQLHRLLSHILSGAKAPLQAAPSLSDTNLAERMPLRILVADDNIVNRKVARALLERWGYSPDLANDGLEVLKAVRGHRYDLVFLDVQMPLLDGIGAARQICSEIPPGERPQLVALTAAAFKQDRDRCLEAGMDGFLSKPLDVADLRTVLEKCYEHRVALRELVPVRGC